MLSSVYVTSSPRISRMRPTVMFSSWPVSALVAGLKIAGCSFALSVRPGGSFSPASVPACAYSFHVEGADAVGGQKQHAVVADGIDIAHLAAPDPWKRQVAGEHRGHESNFRT